MSYRSIETANQLLSFVSWFLHTTLTVSSCRRSSHPRRLIVKDNRNSIRKEVLHLIKFVKKTVAIPTDFTYISIGPKRHVYLCAILDLYSRKCIAWKVSDRIDARLACDTLEIAINKRKPKEPIIFHSEQGSQFKSASFRKLLDEHQWMQKLLSHT